MRSLRCTLWTLIPLLGLALASPAFGDFFAEEVDDGVYFVSYQRGRFTSGSFLDTAKKARRKLERRSHGLCLKQGYGYLRFATLAEISRDPELKAVWEIAVGEEPADTFEPAGGHNDILWTTSAKMHKSRRFLLLSRSEGEGFVPCREK